MKRHFREHENGGVLMMALITVTILTMICATSLYITSQNASATAQATSWQQAMAGAEAAADQAIKALNKGEWSAVGANGERWYTITPDDGKLPLARPSPSNTPYAAGMPGNGQYNFYSTRFTLQGEASNNVTMWVTIDNGSLAPVSSNLRLPTPSPTPSSLEGFQAYRIRAAAAVVAPGPARVSNNKLDNDLRKISLRFDRLIGTAVSSPQAVRRIELVALPVARISTGLDGITLGNWINMSGGGTIDSFDSSDSHKSTSGQYDASKLHVWPDYYGKNAKVGTKNSTNSDLHSTYLYGDLTYSGPAVKNTSHVQGNISSPFDANLLATTAPPTFSTGGQYVSYGGGSPPFTTTAGINKAYIKIDGDFTVPAGQSLNILPGKTQGSLTNDITDWYIYVTGKLTTSGSGYVTQDGSVTVHWYVGGDVTTSGDGFQNQSGLASRMSATALGSGKVTVSGSGNFIGTVNGPGRNMTISGTGFFSGAIVANTLTISGGANFHYDEALGGSAGNTTTENYAYASWFEDNSHPARGITY